MMGFFLKSSDLLFEYSARVQTVINDKKLKFIDLFINPYMVLTQNQL